MTHLRVGEWGQIRPSQRHPATTQVAPLRAVPLGQLRLSQPLIDLIEHGQHPNPPEPGHLRPWTNRGRPAKTAEASAVVPARDSACAYPPGATVSYGRDQCLHADESGLRRRVAMHALSYAARAVPALERRYHATGRARDRLQRHRPERPAPHRRARQRNQHGPTARLLTQRALPGGFLMAVVEHDDFWAQWVGEQLDREGTGTDLTVVRSAADTASPRRTRPALVRRGGPGRRTTRSPAGRSHRPAGGGRPTRSRRWSRFGPLSRSAGPRRPPRSWSHRRRRRRRTPG